MNYEMSLMSYPCFGTVLALRDVFLHLVHLQLMREIPDQQFLWRRHKERETDGLSDRLVSFLFFTFTFLLFSHLSLYLLSPCSAWTHDYEIARLPAGFETVCIIHNPKAGKTLLYEENHQR